MTINYGYTTTDFSTFFTNNLPGRRQDVSEVAKDQEFSLVPSALLGDLTEALHLRGVRVIRRGEECARGHEVAFEQSRLVGGPLGATDLNHLVLCNKWGKLIQYVLLVATEVQMGDLAPKSVAVQMSSTAIAEALL